VRVEKFDDITSWLFISTLVLLVLVSVGALGWFLVVELVDAGARRDCRSAGRSVVRFGEGDKEWRCSTSTPTPERAP
jgi:hypothetical protein